MDVAILFRQNHVMTTGHLDSQVVFAVDFLNIGMQRYPWGWSLVTTILFWLKHNIYAQISEKMEWRKQKKTIINTIIC